MTVIGSGTSFEGDRWVLGRDVYDGFSYTYLEVETPNGHHSKGGYGHLHRNRGCDWEPTPGMTTSAPIRSSSAWPAT
jgi:hypothetical protein